MSAVEPITVPRLETLGLSTDRGLAIIDVDEVLGLFMKGFGDFVARRGYEMRVDRWALFQNIYPVGSREHIDVETGKALMEAFFREGCGELEPAPGAIAALNRIARRADILILSNAPPEAERLRAAWLKRHGLAHPLILNTGPKGPMAAGLVSQTRGRAAFVDDLLQNLDSVAEHAPETATFQHVADERLRLYAPSSERHRRIDDWAELGDAIEAALAGSAAQR